MKNKKDLVYIIVASVLAVFCAVVIIIKISTMTGENYDVTGIDALNGRLPSGYDYDVLCVSAENDELKVLPYAVDPAAEHEESDYSVFKLTDETEFYLKTVTKTDEDGAKNNKVNYSAIDKSDFFKLFVESDSLYMFIWAPEGDECDAVMVYLEQS